MNKNKISDREINTRQNNIFRVLTFIIPVLFFVLLEAFLRMGGYGDNLNLFIENPIEGYNDYLIVNPKVGKKYFQKFEYTAPANDIFLKHKSENTFRIFVMGSSTVYGFPYERNMMFSRILHKELSDAYPEKNIEVVNTSITAINSFTLLDYTNQILKYEPDAILIYAGHNEFYGAFGIGSNETMSKNRGLTRMHITLMDLRIYQFMRNVIAGAAKKIANNNNEQVHGTLMKRIVADKDILLNSDAYKIAMQRYQQNMSEMLKKITDKNIPVFFSEVVCNLKDIKPFNSIASDTLEAAITVYKNAQLSENNGDFSKANELYSKARDLDCIRFRASSDVNRIINNLINQYKVYKVPMVKYFEEASANTLVGNNLMTEHVHPNIDGNFLMANAFFAELKKSNLIGEANNYHNYSPELFKKDWGYTVLDSLVAFHRVQILKGFWPFVLDDKDGYNYKKFYQPVSYIDSLAFSSLKYEDVSLADVRLKLARKYQNEGKIYEAYKEYDALVCTNPYVAINYRDAANCLLQLADIPKALNYYLKSLIYEDSFIANYKLGEIYLIMGDYANAIKYFEKSYPLAPNENRLNVLVKSYISLIYDNKPDKANIILKQLEKVHASKNMNIPPKAYQYSNYIPFQTRTQVVKAKSLLSENRENEALDLLLLSLNIYDSHIANKMIGEIYFNKHDLNTALFYFKKVYPQFKFDVSFLHKLAQLYYQNKDFINAKKCIQEIKTIDQNYAYLEELNSLL